MKIAGFGGLASRIMAGGVMLAVAGCGLFEDEYSCTLEGHPIGVILEVASPMAERADLVSVEQCQEQRCRTGTAQLGEAENGKRAVVLFPEFEYVSTHVQVVLRSSSGRQVYRGEITATPQKEPDVPPYCQKGPQIHVAVTGEGRLVAVP